MNFGASVHQVMNTSVRQHSNPSSKHQSHIDTQAYFFDCLSATQSISWLSHGLINSCELTETLTYHQLVSNLSTKAHHGYSHLVRLVSFDSSTKPSKQHSLIQVFWRLLKALLALHHVILWVSCLLPLLPLLNHDVFVIIVLTCITGLGTGCRNGWAGWTGAGCIPIRSEFTLRPAHLWQHRQRQTSRTGRGGPSLITIMTMAFMRSF